MASYNKIKYKVINIDINVVEAHRLLSLFSILSDKTKVNIVVIANRIIV